VLLPFLPLLGAGLEADLAAICCAPYVFAASGRRPASRFCCYVLCSRRFYCFWAHAWKQILSLLAARLLFFLLLGAGLDADFVASHSVPAVFAASGRTLGSRICCYLLRSRGFGCFWAEAWEQILSLLAILPPF